MEYPACFGNWTHCDANTEKYCTSRYLCYKREEEHTDNTEG